MDGEPVCGFCGDPSSTAWYLIAGPVLHICDRCTALMADITAASSGAPSSSAPADGPFDTCAFCGARSHEVALIVGPTMITDVEPVICHDCVDVCVHAIGRQGIAIDEPWYHELRSQPWVRPLGDIDVSLDIDGSLAALTAALGPVDPDRPGERQRVADAIGDLASERAAVIPYATARGLATAVMERGVGT